MGLCVTGNAPHVESIVLAVYRPGVSH
jgi:hypothetical protein